MTEDAIITIVILFSIAGLFGAALYALGVI